METTTLNASSRDGRGKGAARRLRARGQLPSVAYGGDGSTLSIAVDHDALRDILLSTRGRNTIIDLAVDDAAGFHVMVQDYTVHPLSRRLVHADFIRIDDSKPIEVEIPFIAVGKSKGEIEGGTLLTNTRFVRILCLPTAIPNHIEHDVSALEVNDVVKVKDVTVPEGTKLLMGEEHKLVTVAPPRVEAEPTEGEDGEDTEEGATPAEGDAADSSDSDEKKD